MERMSIDGAESGVGTAAVHRAFAAAADQKTRAVLIAAREGSALLHALRDARFLRIETTVRPFWVFHDALRRELLEIIGPVPIRAPLPDVAGHVIKPEVIRRKRGDRRRSAVTIFDGVLRREASLIDVRHPFTAGLQFVAPGIKFSVQPSARGEFEFGFGRQPLAGPLRISVGVLPRDVNDGMIFAALDRTARAFGIFPVRPWHVSPPGVWIVERYVMRRRRKHCAARNQIFGGRAGKIFWVGFAFGDGLVASGLHELLELSVGDRSFVHPEAVDGDLMGWRGVRHLAVVAAHPESSARYPYHPFGRRPRRGRGVDAYRGAAGHDRLRAA